MKSEIELRLLTVFKKLVVLAGHKMILKVYDGIEKNGNNPAKIKEFEIAGVIKHTVLDESAYRNEKKNTTIYFNPEGLLLNTLKTGDVISTSVFGDFRISKIHKNLTWKLSCVGINAG